MMANDLELLNRYARHGADDSFAILVHRHADLVYAAALRIVRSPELAEDVAQTVFIELARSAKRMKPDTILTAWLHRVTRSKAVDAVRRDAARQRREQVAAAPVMVEPSSVSAMEPMLDDALDVLTDVDRAAVMLRFFEGKSLTDVGGALGISPDAAQKRVSRAVDQLGRFFTKRGIATGTAGLAALLAANTVKAAPPGLAAGICTAVKASGIALTATTTTTSSIINTLAMTSTQQALVAAAALAVGTAGGYFATGGSPSSASHRTNSAPSGMRPSGETTRGTSHRMRSAGNASRKPGRIDRTLALMDYYADLNSTQLAAEVDKLDRLPPAEILVASFLLFSRWGEIDPTAALERAGSTSPSAWSKASASLEFLVPTILRSWASADPKAAGEYCRTHSEGTILRPANIAAELAWQDPDAALAWAKSLDPKDNFAGVCVLRELAKSDPARAWALAAEIDADIRFRAYEEIAGQWAAKDFATAERHIAVLPDDLKNEALSAAVQSLARTDPKRAATQLANITGFVERGRADNAVKESMSRLFPGESANIPPLKPGDKLREDEMGESESMGEDEHPTQLLTDPNFGSWFLKYNQ